MRRVKYLLAALILLLVPLRAQCQKVALSTNVMGYLNLGTLNMEASYSLSRHFTVNAGVKYNPFSFPVGKYGDRMQNRQQTYAVGARYWPWYVYSGWWVAAKAQYSEYNTGGIVSADTMEGDRVGGGITAGYSYMLNPHFNIEVGAGAWMGNDRYTQYTCPTCGRIVEKGDRFFILPNDIIVSFSYVF